ncbi:MAG: hypothetical protein KC776_03145 [Myxococcales bacterium]|nr:hypothetical protein [Myxococcales bacterium]MCB9581667.1 hypothetical protein [Polyangiaceae bacterium]
MKKLLLPLLATITVACGGRPDAWDARTSVPVEDVGLSGSVAIVDSPLDRVMMLTSPSGQNLSATPLKVGKNVVATSASPDREKLFVLSKGVQPRRKPDDERPSLTVIDGGINPKVDARYTLTDPLQGLAIDPQGEWAVVYDAGGIVVNPNELILVKLDGTSEPFPKTIRSFGGRPERLTFTTELEVPNGEPRRFLIVETEQDVTLVDLSDLTRDEVTIILPQTPSGKAGRPLSVAYHDGEPDDPSDARIAVRLASDSNVVIVELGAPAAGDTKPFKPTVNVADVGGVPSDIAFVQTDGGLRLAALVPSAQQATLVDPATTVIETVDLKKAYTRLTRVTDDVADKPVKSDVALLWSDSTTGIAFWSLGKTSGTPFRSVDPYDIGISVASVQNVPGDKYAHLKILESASAAEFYVLDLDQRQSFPMLTNAPGFDLTVSPDGERAWALRPGTPDFASISLSDLHPTSLEVERNVVAVHDFERADGGRAVIALHASTAGDDAHGALGATVLDGLAPDTARSKFFPGLLLGGLQ